MVVTSSTLKSWMDPLKRSLAVCLLAASQPALSDTRPFDANPSETKLSDAWLTTLQQGEQNLAWSHAFALRHSTATTLESQRMRLIHELETVILGSRVVGNAPLAAGLAAWRHELQGVPALPGRTPGRHDLPWLGANLRYDPPISRVRHWGHCAVPTWVEIWHLNGVSRLTWRSGMTLEQALDALPSNASHHVESAVVIAPNGKQTPRGISAWNHQSTPLSPGGRVVLALPPGGSRSGVLSAATQREIALLNQRLPEYLASRLPGVACSLQSVREEG